MMKKNTPTAAAIVMIPLTARILPGARNRKRRKSRQIRRNRNGRIQHRTAGRMTAAAVLMPEAVCQERRDRPAAAEEQIPAQRGTELSNDVGNLVRRG